jgi:[pyruvate, water dikinase]-phosphate phosphotransferase / [pyruvate, water dikinase] kinase
LQSLPKFLKNYRNRLFGLTIDPMRLMQIRKERRPDSDYASAKRCQYEVLEVENLFKREQISFINTTTRSIEEIAAEIVAITGKKRRIFL